VSAELVTPYPPGIPAVAPGEVYNEATLEYLEEIVAVGGFVEGAADQSLDTLRVVAATA
jgi:arginine/lysine/ornithine decarboxylase